MVQSLNQLLTEEESFYLNQLTTASPDNELITSLPLEQPVTEFEECLWLHHQQNEHFPNQFALSYSLGKKLDINRFINALYLLNKQFYAISMSYSLNSDYCLIKTLKPLPLFPLNINIVHSQEEAIQLTLKAQATPFILDQAPLIKFMLFTGAPQGTTFSVIIHRILEGSISWEKLLTCLSSNYNSQIGSHKEVEQLCSSSNIPSMDERRWLIQTNKSREGLHQIMPPVSIVEPLLKNSINTKTGKRFQASLPISEYENQICGEEFSEKNLFLKITADFTYFLNQLNILEKGKIAFSTFTHQHDENDINGSFYDASMNSFILESHLNDPDKIYKAIKNADVNANKWFNVQTEGSPLYYVLVTQASQALSYLKLSGADITPCYLPPLHQHFDIILVLHPLENRSLKVELMTSSNLSDYMGGFLLEKFIHSRQVGHQSNSFLSTIDSTHNKHKASKTDTSNPLKNTSEESELDITNIILNEFREALSSPNMGVNDDFFDYGGHSLIATRIIGRLLSKHHIEVHINDLFSHSNASALSAHATYCIKEKAKQEKIFITDNNRFPLSLAQQSLWKVYAAFGYGNIFNIPFALKFLTPINENTFRLAFLDILERHPIFRTLFIEENSTVYQKIIHPDNIERYKWFWFSDESNDTEVLKQEAEYPFVLSEELPLRIRFIKDHNTGQQILSLLFHHVILDEWSVNLLMDELAFSYKRRIANNIPVWKTQPLAFYDYALKQNNAGMNKSHLNYWVNRLSNLPKSEPLFGQQKNQCEQSVSSLSAGGWVESKLDNSITEMLYLLAKRHGASLFNVIYASISTTLYLLGGQKNLLIGTSASGRDDPDFFDTIGYFTTVVAHNVHFNEQITLKELIAQIKNGINESLPYSDIPIDLVEEALFPHDKNKKKHMFEVFIQLHAKNKLNGAIQLDDGNEIIFQQIDPEKSESLLGLHFEVMEEVINHKRTMRLLLSYRSSHYSSEQITLITETINKVLAYFCDLSKSDFTISSLRVLIP